jgi:hypothetical protein
MMPLILCAEFYDSLLESMKLAFGYLHWSVMLIERSGIRGEAHARPSVLTLRNILEAMGQSVTLEFLTLPVNLSRFSICARFVCVTRLVFVFYKFRDIADNAFQCESSGFLLGNHLPDNALPHLLVFPSHLIFSFVVVRGSILVIDFSLACKSR